MGEEFFGALGELAADFAALAFDPGDRHVVVAGSLVAHPCDGGGFGALLDRDTFGARHGATANGRGVSGDPIGHRGRGELVARMKREVGENSGAKVGGIRHFRFGASLAAGIEFRVIARISTLQSEVSAESVDALCRSPNPAREAFVALLFDHDPGGSIGLDPATQGGVSGREEFPIVRHGEYPTTGVEDMTRFSERADFQGLGRGGVVRGRTAHLGERFGNELVSEERNL